MFDDNNIFDFDESSSVDNTSDADTDIWSIDEQDLENSDYFDEYGVHEQSFDLDGDGIDDTVFVDIDENGDSIADISGVSVDLDGDGIIDATSYSADIDHDGDADLFVTEADLNFDGVADYTEATVVLEDENGSMKEFFIKATDLDFDGVIDDVDLGFENSPVLDAPDNNDNPFLSDDSVDSDDSDFSDVEDSDYGYFVDTDDSDEPALILPYVDYDGDADNATLYEDLTLFDPSEVDPANIIGNPEEVLDLWETQGSTSRCALYAQKFVIEEYTGTEVDIEDLVDIAESNGWFYENDGTPVMYMDELLEYYDVPYETTFDASITDIAESLNEGHKVIVSLDADEYWYGENDSVYAPDGINHAVEVIGINNSDPDNPTVILNDSGVPYGAGLEVPMDAFLDAWEDGCNHMIECM